MQRCKRIYLGRLITIWGGVDIIKVILQELPIVMFEDFSAVEEALHDIGIVLDHGELEIKITTTYDILLKHFTAKEITSLEIKNTYLNKVANIAYTVEEI